MSSSISQARQLLMGVARSHFVSIGLVCGSIFSLVYGVELVLSLWGIALALVFRLLVAAHAAFGLWRLLRTLYQRRRLSGNGDAWLALTMTLAPLGVLVFAPYDTVFHFFLARHEARLEGAIKSGPGLYQAGLFKVQFEIPDTVDGVTYIRAGTIGWDDSLWLIHCDSGPLKYESFVEACVGLSWPSRGIFEEVRHVRGPWYYIIH